MSNAELIDGIQAIMSTLEAIEIKATFDNLDKLLGCQQLLKAMMSELKKEADNGNTDSE